MISEMKNMLDGINKLTFDVSEERSNVLEEEANQKKLIQNEITEN